MKELDILDFHICQSLFVSTFVNGEKINRIFLVYSSSKGSLFCAPCYLFGGTTLFFTVGFSDWNNSVYQNANNRDTQAADSNQWSNVSGK